MKNILYLLVVIALLDGPEIAAAQPTGKIPRVGVLFIGGRNQPHLESFKQGLKERGYTEGKNILLDYRYAEGNVDRLPSLAAELVQLKVDVIVTTSGNSARAATQATRTIPIVLTTGADPVKSGLAESLAKPGGQCYRSQRYRGGFKRETCGDSERDVSENDAHGVSMEPSGGVLLRGGRAERQPIL
jgi:putative tryptophan/tyrosine transport system substrate-binding protein